MDEQKTDNQGENGRKLKVPRLVFIIIATIIIFIFLFLIFGTTNPQNGTSEKLNFLPTIYAIIIISIIVSVIFWKRRLGKEKNQYVNDIILTVLKVTLIDTILGFAFFWLLAGLALGMAIGGGDADNPKFLLIMILCIILPLAVHILSCIKFWRKKYRDNQDRIKIFLIIFFAPLIIVLSLLQYFYSPF